MGIMIEKRDGRMEPLDPSKYHSHVEHAVDGIDGVSISEIEMNASIHIVNGSKSQDIQNAFIKSTVDGIYENPKLDKVAARLLNQDLRKKVYGDYNPTDTMEIVMKNCDDGIYDKDYLLDNYNNDEILDLLSYIDYEKDDKFTYGGLRKNMDSYLIKHYGQIRETPQELYMMLNMFAFAKYKDKYNAEFRKKWILNGYECMSEFYASLPTPMIKQLRTTFRRFISCVLIPLGDTKHTIANANRAILILVSGGCGIGLGASDLRGLNAYIDNGRMKHEGIQPILKGFEKNSKAFTQPDRDGSSSEFYPFFHIEVEKYLVLGNAKGTDDVRVRDMDHAIMFNDFFFERYYNNEDITLFYMNDVPDIMSYIGDYDEFKKRYLEAEAKVPQDRQTKIPAALIFDTFISERVLTSRQYTAFMDNIQEQGLYDVPIKQSNLCVSGETYILTKEYGNTKIGPLVESGITEATCWNGIEWSKTILAKTSESASVIRVTLSNGWYIDATPEHKWYIEQGSNVIEMRTHELVVTDIIAAYKLPDADTVKEISGVEILCLTKLNKEVSTYCGNEPKEHKLIFNGVLTGNCVEITQPNFPLYDVINIKRNIKFASEQDRFEYYELRREAYFNQDSSEIVKYQNKLAKYYTFTTDDFSETVDESKDYDYFNLYGKVNLSEIGVCIIAGINLGITPVEKLSMVSEYLVRLEDELIDYMDYDLPEIEKAAKLRRGIGIGFSDVFHLLAKNKVKYNTVEGRQLLHDRVEICAYHMTRTSIQLAKDFGPCQLISDTKYRKGIMPVDTYRKTVDELLNVHFSMDWEGLRILLSKYGIRHSTLMANAPFGSSSIPSNSTPGIEPPRYLVAKKDGLPKIVPEYEEYGDEYTLVWDDDFDMVAYIKFIAVMQKFMDQSVSMNEYVNLLKYEDNKIPKSVLINHVLLAQYYGHKTMYYLNMHSKKENVSQDGLDIDKQDEIKTTAKIMVEETKDICGSGGCLI